MSDITTDFIKATNRILAKVAAVLTHVQVIEGDVKSIREHSVEHSHKPETDSNADNSDKQPTAFVHSDTSQSSGKKNNSKDNSKRGFEGFAKRWRKSLRKPIVQLEIGALIGLALYICETHRTNNLTQKALNIQSSQSRAFIQITGTNFVKGSIEDVQKAGAFFVEVQNVGKSTASKLHGDFVVELPLANQGPSFNFNTSINRITHSPLYPSAPPEPIQLLFVAGYGTVMQIPPSVIEELKLGTRYAVIFGRVEYEDAFGEWWTQSCGWRHFMPISNQPHIVGFAASTCIDYNVEGGATKQK